MRKVIRVTGIFLLSIFTMSSCAYIPQNLQGKRIDANSSFCRQLLTQTGHLFRVMDQREDPNLIYKIQPIGFVPVSPMDRNIARLRHASECETETAYKQRKKIDLVSKP